VQHYWTCRKDYLVTVDNLVEGSGHDAIEQVTPNWKEDLVKECGVGVKPEGSINLYTSSTNVVIRRVFKNCSLEQDGITIHPRGAELPLLFKPGQNKRPMTMNTSDEAGQNTKMLFRPFEFPEGIPGIKSYQEFIDVNFSEWKGNKPVHFFERKPFYRALNCAICQDAPNVLQGLKCIVTDMCWFINQTRHGGGLVYSGVGLGGSIALVKAGAKLRMPRFLSTTTKIEFALTRITGKVSPALLVIRVPRGYWGARDITSFSACPEEEETIFVAHALFEVESVDSMEIEGGSITRIILKAIDKYDEHPYDESAYPAAVDVKNIKAPVLKEKRWSRESGACGNKAPQCMTPRCCKPTWNGQPDGYCSRSCKMTARKPKDAA